MAERDAQSLEIGLGHIGQDLEIDGILGEDGRVLPEPDLIEPSRYVVIDTHCRTRPIPLRLPVLRRRPASMRRHRQANWSCISEFPVHGLAQPYVRGSNPSERQQHTALRLSPM